MTTATLPGKTARPALPVQIQRDPEQTALPAQGGAESLRMEQALAASPGFPLDGPADLVEHNGSVTQLTGGYLLSLEDGRVGGQRTRMAAGRLFHYYLPFGEMSRPRHAGPRQEARPAASAAAIDAFERAVRSTAPSALPAPADPHLHAELRLRLGRGWLLWTDSATIGGVGCYYIPDESPGTAYRNFDVPMTPP